MRYNPVLLAILLIAASAQSFAATWTAGCSVQYVNANTNQVLGSPYARNCNFAIRFGSNAGYVDRYYSCAVAQNSNSCSVTIGDSAINPNWAPFKGWSTQTFNDTDNSLGCTAGDNSPSVNLFTTPGGDLNISVIQTYFCTGL